MNLFRSKKPDTATQFHTDLIEATQNFRNVTWLGNPIWQNILDLWTIQEVISSIKPSLLIECGTNQGGSSLFFAHLMDLLGHGEIITVDVEKLHELSHPRITYLLGSSTAPGIAETIYSRAAAASGPVMVILDSDHSAKHVLAELELYARLVTPGSYCLVQDGCIDTLPMYASARPGPLVAIKNFLETESHGFSIDHDLCNKFLITHSPNGWLKRLPFHSRS